MANKSLCGMVTALAFWASACSKSPYLKFSGEFLEHHPAVIEEMNNCARLPEVPEVLSYDPLKNDSPITLHISEAGYTGIDSGRTMDGTNAWIDGWMYHPQLPAYSHFLEESIFNAGPLPGETKLQFHQRVEEKARHLYEARSTLLNDKELAFWYRCGVIVHELSHLKAKQQAGYREHETGHGITDRVEVRLFTLLYHHGKISPHLWQRLFTFHTTFSNDSREDWKNIFRYHNRVFTSSPVPEDF